MLIRFLKKFWRLVKQNLLRIILARSPVYFIVLMLILYYHFYVTNYNLFSVDVSVSVNNNITGCSILIFDKNFNFSLYNSSRLSYEVRKYKKINLSSPKGSGNSDSMNISSSFLYFWFLLIL